jgi:acetolactate synthase I/II/III large subunit
MGEDQSITVSQAYAKIIKAYEAEYIFTFTGAPQDPVMHAHTDEGVRCILGRSERSVMAMADAYARITGKPAFGYVQFGPGASYLPPIFTEATWGRSPLVVLAGAVNGNNRHRFEYQEFDQIPALKTLVKWAGQVPKPHRIADMMRSAIRAAVGGVPGPAYIEVGADDLQAPIDTVPDLYAEESFKQVGRVRGVAADADIDKAAEILMAAKKPVIVAGGGAMISGAWDEVRKLAADLRIPVVTSMAGKGIIGETDPLSVGVMGRYSRKVANDVMAGADTVLVVGSRMGTIVSDYGKFPAPGTKVIHIDIDPEVLGTTMREDASLLGDAQLTVERLSEATHDLQPSWNDWTDEVMGRVAAWKAEFRKLAQEKTTAGRINPVHVMGVLNDLLGGDDVLVADTGYMAAWGSTLIEQKRAGRNTLRAAGSLGWAFPAAFGARLGVGPSRRVLCLTGDGGLGYHIGDLETAVRLGMPTVTVVMNNATLAFEYHVQKYLHDFMTPEASELVDVDHAAVARAYGAHGERVTDPDQIGPAILRAFDSGRPAIVDLVISPEVAPPVSRYEAAGVRPL